MNSYLKEKPLMLLEDHIAIEIQCPPELMASFIKNKQYNRFLNDWKLEIYHLNNRRKK